MKYWKWLMGLTILLSFFSGCSTKIPMSYLQSPQISATLTPLAIQTQNDTIDFTTLLRNAMTQHNAALGQPYFKFDPTGRTHINATLTPTIQRQTSLTTKPNGQCIRRIQNPDGKYRCEGFGHDLLQCEDLTLGLDIHTRINQGTLVLFDETFSQKTTSTACNNAGSRQEVVTLMLPTKKGAAPYPVIFPPTFDPTVQPPHQIIDPALYTMMGQTIAQNIVEKLAPTPIPYRVKLLERCDCDLNTTSKESFKNALLLIEQRDLSALPLFVSLQNSYPDSYVLAYDCGLSYELQGDYTMALRAYLIAQSHDKDHSVPEITEALTRIRNLLFESERSAVFLSTPPQPLPKP